MKMFSGKEECSISSAFFPSLLRLRIYCENSCRVRKNYFFYPGVHQEWDCFGLCYFPFFKVNWHISQRKELLHFWISEQTVVSWGKGYGHI